jgi:hypothetical protein
MMLLTKALQNIANNVLELQKEEYMTALQEFMEKSIEPTNKFLGKISNPDTLTGTKSIKELPDSIRMKCFLILHGYFKKVIEKDGLKFSVDATEITKKRVQKVFNQICEVLDLTKGRKLRKETRQIKKKFKVYKLNLTNEELLPKFKKTLIRILEIIKEYNNKRIEEDIPFPSVADENYLGKY